MQLQGGIVRILEYLLQNGAGLEAPDPNGRTPLHYAVIFGRAQAVALLLRRGANRCAGRISLMLGPQEESSKMIYRAVGIRHGRPQADKNDWLVQDGKRCCWLHTHEPRCVVQRCCRSAAGFHHRSCAMSRRFPNCS